MTNNSSHWQSFHRRWSLLEAPLRPNTDILAGIVGLVGARTQRILLLGVTPELALAFDTMVAVDKSATMIGNIWPGDSATRHAIEADWLTLDGSLGHFSAAVGDGSCNAVAYPGELTQLLGQVHGHLETGGRFVCRVFLRPDLPWSWTELKTMAAEPAGVNFHAFKWMLAMRIAADTEPSVPVARIRERFDQCFPDRKALAACTGWAEEVIAMIDIYRDSSEILCFPTRAEFLACLPPGFTNIGIHPCGTYDLAGASPLLCCEKS